MAKNILIFSDGTGQGGGVILDERRSNVYKLFRATRSAPDTRIPPNKQIAFYDPGLGSSRDNEHIKFGWLRKIYNFFAKVTGLGITHNIIDCYAFIVQHWQKGDRVYLYGFSRGAYTARCVGGVMAYCGVPTMEDGKPIKRDAKTARRIAEEAVVMVYQHGVGRKHERFAQQRKELAANFREKYVSEIKPEKAKKGWSNAVPYFIGVWDTVAALGASWPKLIGLYLIAIAAVWSFFALLLKLFILLKWVDPKLPYLEWTVTFVIASAALAVIIYAMKHIRWTTETSHPWWRTLHIRAWKMKFYDTYLNPRVQYAKHALSVDENRFDFARVAWTDDSKNQRSKAKDWFEQIWFSGVHSDIGGSYPETESRLSDVALGWMVERTKNAKHPIVVDDHYLRIYPDATGVQHDERKSGWLPWKLGLRTIHEDAPLHLSVIERFEADEVVNHDDVKPYRPKSLRNHKDTKQYYT